MTDLEKRVVDLAGQIKPGVTVFIDDRQRRIIRKVYVTRVDPGKGIYDRTIFFGICLDNNTGVEFTYSDVLAVEVKP